MAHKLDIDTIGPGHFTPQSFSRSDDVGADAFALYGMLLSYADSSGYAWPSRNTLAKRLKRSTKWVSKYTAELERMGWLTVERSRDKDGNQLTNRYTVHRVRQSKKTEKSESNVVEFEGNKTPTLGNEVPRGRERGSPTLGNEVPPNYNQLTISNELTRTNEDLENAKMKPDKLTDVLTKAGPGYSQTRVPVVDDLFNDFWKIYPRRVAKQKALVAFRKIIMQNLATPEEVMEGARKARAHYDNLPANEKVYTKHPTTWLNGHCWMDELPDVKANTFHIGY